MTICVGAISKNSGAHEQYAVVASDRMATLRIPSIEWEQNLPKTIVIANNCVASTAGSAIGFTDILNLAKPQIENLREKNIEKITEIIRQSFETVRRKKMNETIFAKLGISFSDFYRIQQTLSPQIVAKVFDAMAKYDYPLAILVAGVDDNGPHIFTITNPGRADCFDAIGYHAIGSGQIHALTTYITNDYDPALDLNHVTAMTYEAKKRSEKAQGVGAESDLYIICNNRVVKMPEEVIDRLLKIYNKTTKLEKKTFEQIEQEVKKLNMEEMEKQS